jgi:hypothetical protein
MSSLITTLKNNKLAVILAAMLLLFVARDFKGNIVGISPFTSKSYPSYYAEDSYMSLESSEALGMAPMMAPMMARGVMPVPINNPPPIAGPDRLLVQDTSLSLVVRAVDQTITAIETIATQNGGYLVDSNRYSPEGAASGHITIRVPATNRSQVLEAIKQTGTKVVSESVTGHDVTDQYADLEARISNLAATVARFETIRDQAVNVSQLLEVTREIANLQAQIDSLRGRQQYLAQTAQLTRITISLSTDELALPYAPDRPWTPAAIFKQAVRSLIGTFRSVGSLAIWVAVYAPVWAPVAAAAYFIHRRQTRKKSA